MSTYYELMDLDSANVVGFYGTKDAALAIVRTAYERYGLAGIEDLALTVQSAEDDGVWLGEGVELLTLATEQSPAEITG